MRFSQNLAEELGPSVEILRIRNILFAVVSAVAGEDAIRADMHKASSHAIRSGCELMGEKRVKPNRCFGVTRDRFDDAQRINDQRRTHNCDGAINRRLVAGHPL